MTYRGHRPPAATQDPDHRLLLASVFGSPLRGRFRRTAAGASLFCAHGRRRRGHPTTERPPLTNPPCPAGRPGPCRCPRSRSSDSRTGPNRATADRCARRPDHQRRSGNAVHRLRSPRRAGTPGMDRIGFRYRADTDRGHRLHPSAQDHRPAAPPPATRRDHRRRKRSFPGVESLLRRRARYGGLMGDVVDASRFLLMHLNDGELDGNLVLAPRTARGTGRLDYHGNPSTTVSAGSSGPPPTPETGSTISVPAQASGRSCACTRTAVSVSISVS